MGAAPPHRRTLELAAIGTAGGLLSGLFGVGGGAVVVPLLVLWLAYPEREAAATSLAAIVAIAGFAAAGHGLYGNVDVQAGLLVGVPAVGGVVLGTWLRAARARRHDRAVLRGAARGGRRPPGGRVILAVAIGVLAGVASGLLGIGGGILLVPALAILLGLGQLEAEATSLLAIVPVALVGTWRQLRYGNVRLGDAATIGLLSLAGAAAGVAAANALPERALRVGFALLLLAMAAQLVRRGLAGRRTRLAARVS